MFDKAKQHFRDNKKTYIACGVTAVIVGGITYYFTRKASITMIENVEVLNQVYQTGLINRNTIEVYIEALGDPGNIIQDLTTGSIYASQGQAARELGLSSSEISKHLNGLTDAVKGHRFERIAKASVSPLSES